MTNVALFDMNETTLDLADVRATVNDVLGSEHGFTMWFQKLLQLAMTSAITDSYQDFGVLAPSALRTTAASIDRTLAADAVPRVGASLAAIAPYPDVVEGLESLREAGWKTMPLTNSSLAGVTAQVDGNGLGHLFDEILSVDLVQRFKPHRAPYLHALEIGGADPEHTWLVACHDWDLQGARSVGLRTAYVRRPHMHYADSYPPADVSVNDFVELAAALTGSSF
ncbi:MAG: haloacid dehalogenase type II [Acidimicrobiia bacterium]|nr:haloacid dehalogenase type II [Acidimicrobiia bacterium]